MKRMLSGALAALILLSSFPLRAFAQPPGANPMSARGGSITPRSFEFNSLPGRSGDQLGLIAKRKPEGINRETEARVEALKLHPQGLTPDRLGLVTLDRTTGVRGFSAQADLSPLAPAINNGFDGITQGPYIPSEPTVAAGALNILSAGNVSITVTNKDGTNKVETNGATFFGVPAAEGAISDAQCYYDALRGRFVALCFTQGTTPNFSFFYLAVSKTNDARGAWWLYKFDMTLNGATASSNWADYQALGVSDDKIAMTGQMFSFAGDAYQYQKVRVLDRAGAYSGATLSYVDFFNFAAPPGGDIDDLFVTKAARNLSAGDNTIHLLCVRTAGGTNVTYRTITGTPAAPALSAGTRVTVATYTPPPDAVQKGSATLVPTNDCRPTDFYVRGGVLVCAWHTAANLGGQVAALRLFRLRTSDQVVLTDETYGAAGTFYYYPAVTVDSVGTVFLGFDRSSSTEYPSAYATGKRRGEATLQSSALLKAGVSSTSQTRWGDYTGIDNDASASGPNASVAWYAGQYTKGTNTFGTWVNKLTYSYGQISGTVANDCDGIAGTTADRTPLTGFTVTLKQGATTVGATISGAAGDYSFGYLETGLYDVVVTAPVGGSTVDAIAGTGATSQTRVSDSDVQVNLTNAQISTGNAFVVSTAHTTAATTSISPNSKNVGDGAFPMTVNGTGFLLCSVVRLDGADRATTYVSSTQLTAQIPASDMLAGAVRNITVFHTAPGGGVSNAQTFTIGGTPDTQAPVATLTSPAGGESWPVGSSQNITWTATDDIVVSSIDLALSTDGGASFPTTIATAIANSGTFAWTVPGTPSSTARVRVVARDGANNLGSDSTHTNFTISGFLVTASAGANGTISPSGAVAVAPGATPSYVISPAAGYHVLDVLVNGGSVGPVTNYTFAAISSNQTIAATFAINLYTLAVTVVGSGSVVKSPDQPTYDSGTVVQLTATPAAGWNFTGWSGDASGITNPLGVTMSANKNITATFTQHIYTWAVTGSGLWGTAANWSPARTTPATDDILIFDNGATTTATSVPTQTIGQLRVLNNTSVLLQPAAAVTLTVLGSSGTDLSVATGSALRMTAASALTIALVSGATGAISGNLTVTSAAHRLVALDAGSVLFQNGSLVSVGTGATGNLFGTGTGTSGLNSVVFQGGSIFAQSAGANPFGASAPNSVVMFQAGSRFRLDGAVTPSVSGRQYADFEHNTSGTTSLTGATAFGMDSLIVTQGTLNLNLTGGGTVRGDVRVRAAATLTCSASSGTPVIQLGGSVAQSVQVLGAFSTTSNTTLQINNPLGVTLQSNLTPGGTVNFVAGRITTGANTLIIPAAGTVTGAAPGTGWVVGSLRRNFPVGASSRTFDVGDGTVHAPITVAMTGAVSTFDATGSTTTLDHPNLATSDLNAAKTVNRFWTLTPVGSPSFTGYDATFQFDAADIDAGALPGSFVLRRFATGVWSPLTAGILAATSSQATAVTSFGDFAVGQTVSYTITASAGASGTITPSGAVGVASGANQSFTIVANAGSVIADVLVDGASVGAVGSFAFTNVTANHTIAASFTDIAVPVATVTAPNGGETLTIGTTASLTWTATDNVAVSAVDLLLSTSGAAGPFSAITTGIANAGTYAWTVAGPATSNAFLKVVAHDAAGNSGEDVSDAAFAIASTTAADVTAVTAFSLAPVTPNPTRGAGRVEFALPRTAEVRVSVVDLMGREVMVLTEATYEAGRHSVSFAGTRSGMLNAGLYFVQMRVSGQTFNRRFAVTR
ncbi:MAG: Ser-Thr-rich GPI-anchored membrane family protein [Candidatus Eisenbacteria bacterium]